MVLDLSAVYHSSALGVLMAYVGCAVAERRPSHQQVFRSHGPATFHRASIARAPSFGAARR